jgi:hypothetical protein
MVRERERESTHMIDLLGVNTYAQIAADKLAGESDLTDQFTQLVSTLDTKLADRGEILAKLESKAEEIGSDNLWNRYESADQAYAYGLDLRSLLEDYLSGYEDREGLEWQIADLVKSTGSELWYRLERAQW